MTAEMQAAITRYFANGGKVTTLRPKRRWKYGVHSEYMPGYKTVKGRVPT
jgi:hypothetical protein